MFWHRTQVATRYRPKSREFGAVALGIDQYNTDDDLSIGSFKRNDHSRPKRWVPAVHCYSFLNRLNWGVILTLVNSRSASSEQRRRRHKRTPDESASGREDAKREVTRESAVPVASGPKRAER